MEMIILENDLVIKTLSTPEEMEASFRLRNEVFAGELNWVPGSVDGMEVDDYDGFSHYVGVFDLYGELVGNIRITPSPHRFMIEREFSNLMPEGARISKAADVAEVTRLCVRKEDRSAQYQTNVSLCLYKGLYHWNMQNGFRHTAMVVDYRCYRLLRLTGLPVKSLYPFMEMPDGVKAAVCMLDWREFETHAGEKKPEFLDWMTRLPVHHSSQLLSHGLYSRR